MKNQLFLHGNCKHRRSLLGVAFLSLFMLSAAFFVACDKDTPVAVDNQSNLVGGDRQATNLPNVKVMEKVKFSFNGKLYEIEEFQRLFKDSESPMMVTGSGLPDPNVVYVFESETAFNTWIKGTRYADQLAQVSKKGSGTTAEILAGGIAHRVTLYDDFFFDPNLGYYKTSLSMPTLPSSIDNKASSLVVRNDGGATTVFCYLHKSQSFKDQLPFLIITDPGEVSFCLDLKLLGLHNNISSVLLLY